MSLGLAIFASVVLVLAVYHRQFRRVLLYTIVIGAVLGAIGFGGVYLYDRHEAAKNEKHRQAVNSCIERNRNVGDVFDQVIALKGKSLEERCDSDPEFKIISTGESKASTTPGVIQIYGGETLKIAKASEATSGSKKPDFIAVVPLLYLGRDQRFTVTCGTYQGNIDGSNPSFSPVIEGTTITCK